MQIVFATNNAHKLSEIRQILGHKIEVLSLSDIGCHDDIPETGTTLEANALQKARYIRDKYGYDCFADDTGLEVDALGGEPGIYSARYAGGEGHDSEANMQKLLQKLDGEANRAARFRTVIALVQGSKEQLFEGIVEGTILLQRAGKEGFGYDPVFAPLEADGLAFAQMSAEAKNAISHRGRATKKLAEYLLREK